MALTSEEQPAIPDHVPEDLVREIGFLTGPEYLADPYRFLSGLHDKQPPLFYNLSEAMGNTWMTIKHDLAFEILRDTDSLTTEIASIFPRDPDNYFHLIPQEIDPPDHRKYRNILDPLLSPKAVKQLERDIKELANDLIDNFIDKGECEFSEEFARPLPVTVFLKFMGLPRDMTDTFVKWVVSLIQFAEYHRAVEIMAEIEDYLTSVIKEKRSQPDSGAISRIVHAEIDGQPLSEREIYGYTFFLFIAGIDTVYATFNNAWVWLAQNPRRRHEIIAAPGNIAKQVEELLRVFGVTFSGRKLTRDYQLNGVQMKKGDRIMCLLPACNYDPEAFPNPREVRFDRPRRPHLTFTGGVHACMGAHLARLEFRVALQEWLRRIPEFSLKPGTQITYSPSGVIGPDKVPLVW